MARSLLSSRCYRGLHATLRAVFIAAATLLTRECGSSRLNVRYSCAIPPRLLVLRGGGLGNWEEVSNALEDSRRELTVDVEDGCTYLGDKLFQCSSLQRLVIKGGLAALPQEIGA